MPKTWRYQEQEAKLMQRLEDEQTNFSPERGGVYKERHGAKANKRKCSSERMHLTDLRDSDRGGLSIKLCSAARDVQTELRKEEMTRLVCTSWRLPDSLHHSSD